MVLSARDAISMMLGLKAMTIDCKAVVSKITLDDFKALAQDKGRILSVAERLGSMKTICEEVLERAEDNKPFKPYAAQQDLFEAFVEFEAEHAKLLEALVEKGKIVPTYLPITKIAHAIEDLHDAIQSCVVRLARLCPAWSTELLEYSLPELDTKVNKASGSWLGSRDDEAEGAFDFELTDPTDSETATP